MLGDIRMYAGQDIPEGWELCKGQSLTISDNKPLYEVLGTTYGGDGGTTFNLPNMDLTAPIHQGEGPGLTPRMLGGRVGASTFSLTSENVPKHNHKLMASADDADTSKPYSTSPTTHHTVGSVLAKGPGTTEKNNSTRIYSTRAQNASMQAEAVPYEPEYGNYGNEMLSWLVSFIIETKEIPEYQPMVGEISIFSYADVPANWTYCNGRKVPRHELPELYNVISNQYKNRLDATFYLPNLLTGVPIGNNSTNSIGVLGANFVSSRWPLHQHVIRVDSSGRGADATNDPEGSVLGISRFQGTTNNDAYASGGPEIPFEGRHLNETSISNVGGNVTKRNPNTKNMQPYLGLTFAICYRSINPG